MSTPRSTFARRDLTSRSRLALMLLSALAFVVAGQPNRVEVSVPTAPAAAHGKYAASPSPRFQQHGTKALKTAVLAASRVSSLPGRSDKRLPYSVPRLSFEPNQGQTDRRVRFLAHGLGYALMLTSRQAVLELKPAAGKQGTVVRMKLVGAATETPRMSGLHRLPGKSNYLIGRDPSKWRTGIPTYARVMEHGVYPGVDLVYYGHQRQLEYDFLVAAKADVQAIRLQLDGARKLRLDSAGNLVVAVPGGELTFRKPVAYQKAGGRRQSVEAGYVIEGKRSVAFRVGKYNRAAPLIIDPTLAYSTYLGGSSTDAANAIAVLSADGTAFVTGQTFSSDLPLEHPLQPTSGGSDFPTDAFITRLGADGSVLYTTYLGGSGRDTGNGIAVDPLGDAYVTGTTLSSDFPTTPGAFDTTCPPDGECGASVYPSGLTNSAGFLSKLNPAGSALVYSTYFGGTGNTRGQAVVVDSGDNAYVTGSTQAADFPHVVPQCLTFTGRQNVFVLKLNASGSRALYSGTIGGSLQDSGFGIGVDPEGNASVTGTTYSANFPTTASAFQTSYGGDGDAFLTTINTAACSAGRRSISYSTFLGGKGQDEGKAVAVDTAGKAYVTGRTQSADFPSTSGAYQTACKLDSRGACAGDAFVANFDPTQPGAGSLLFSTFLGGSSADSGNSIGLGPSGNVYITGSTASADFPLAAAAFQSAYGGGAADAFFAKVNPAGTALVSSSYLGGSGTEAGNGIAVDTLGDAYLAGQTCSTDFPLSSPAQRTAGGKCDAFISKVIGSSDVALRSSEITDQALGGSGAMKKLMVPNPGPGVVTRSGSVARSKPGSRGGMSFASLSGELDPTTQLGSGSGAVNVMAGGTNQNVVLAPSGAGILNLRGSTEVNGGLNAASLSVNHGELMLNPGGIITADQGVAIRAGGADGNITLAPSGSGLSAIQHFADKGGQVFNVRAYGAKCNGSTDDTSAFRAAVAAAQAAGRSVAFVPPSANGCVISSYLALPATVTLAGAGRWGTGSKILFSGSGGGTCSGVKDAGFLRVQGSNVTVRDLDIETRNSTAGTCLINVNDGGEASGVTVQSVRLIGGSTSSNNLLIQLHSTDTFRLYDSLLENGRQLLVTDNVSNFVSPIIRGNVFSSGLDKSAYMVSIGTGGFAYAVDVEDNLFEMYYTQLAAHISGNGGLKFSGNTLDDGTGVGTSLTKDAIYLSGTGPCTVEANTIINNTSNAYFGLGTNCTRGGANVAGNTLIGASYAVLNSAASLSANHLQGVTLSHGTVIDNGGNYYYGSNSFVKNGSTTGNSVYNYSPADDASAKGLGAGVPAMLKKLYPRVFSKLPACSSAYEGSVEPITDSTTNVIGAVITGGGSSHVEARCGTQDSGTTYHWTVAAQ